MYKYEPELSTNIEISRQNKKIIFSVLTKKRCVKNRSPEQLPKLYKGDTDSFKELIEEYRGLMEAAPLVSEDLEIKTKSYWQDQIDWLSERFPEGKYRDVVGLCKVAVMDGEDGIIDQDYSLNAGRYVGVVIEDDGMTLEEFTDSLKNLSEEFSALNSNADDLEKLISENMQKLLGGQ